MPRQVTQEAFTTFVGGLITEAGKLTFPKNASIDELNCLLGKAGNRRRRLGVNYESGYEISSESYSAGSFTSIFIWDNVGGQSGKQFIVVQIGGTLRFYDNAGLPISDQEVMENDSSSTPYIISLSTYEIDGGSSSTDPIDVVSIEGRLVVVGKSINPFYIEMDTTDGSFSEHLISFRIRDYIWLGDRTSYDTQLATASVTAARKYDTYNCGWEGGDNNVATNARNTYVAAETAWPPLTHPWFSGKDASGAFSVAEFQAVFSGTSRLTNGHFVYDLFDVDRVTKSGLSGVTNYTEKTRFTTATAYASRLFYSGMTSNTNSSKIFFSQILEDFSSQVGECLQLNDPTAEYLSDLLDTDGGWISIPEAHNIKKLHVFGPRLLVFAENGVWVISGVDDVFRATEYSVSKISEIGLDNIGSFVSAGGRPYWWSYTGIHTITVNEQGAFEEVNTSIDTIQSFWDDITPTQRGTVSSTYDSLSNKVFWFYPSSDETIDNKYNEVLVFDEALQAFYPWRVEDKATDNPHIIGVFFFRNTAQGLVSHDVVDTSGNPVYDASGNQVIAFIEGRTDAGASRIRLLVRDYAGGITFGEFSDTSFLDWGSENYSSYAEAGYNFQGDMSTYKTTPYITVYLDRTETGWGGNENDGYYPIRPSSILVSSFVDFKTTASSSAQQGYRYKLPLFANPSSLSTFGYPYDTISTRLKLRGRGKSFKIRFESEEGKDFNLLGWEVIGFKNANL